MRLHCCVPMRLHSCVPLLFSLLCGGALAQVQPEKPAEPKRLTFGISVDGVYSPDGQWIAFASNRAGNDPETLDVYRVSAAGTQVERLVVRLTRHPGWDIHPRWSPDGREVLLNSTRGSENTQEPELFELYAVGD